MSEWNERGDPDRSQNGLFLIWIASLRSQWRVAPYSSSVSLRSTAPLAGNANSHRSHDIISPLIGGDVGRTEGVEYKSSQSHYCLWSQPVGRKSQLSRDDNIPTNIKSKIFLDFSEQIMIVKQEKKNWFQPFIYYYNKPWIKLTLWKRQSNFL